MRKLVILPLGETDGAQLTAKGQEQMSGLAGRLAPKVASLPSRQIYSSLSDESYVSAIALGGALDVPTCMIRRDMALGNVSGRALMPDQIFSMIEQVEAACDLLILVMHRKSFVPFVSYFMGRWFARESPEGEAEPGQAILINIDKQTRELV